MNSVNKSKGVAIVTGGTSGIGLATAQKLSEMGYQPVLMGRDEHRGIAAQHKVPKSTYISCDVTDTQSIKEAVQQAGSLGPITAVVLSAGQYREGLIENLTDKEMKDLFEVNTFGVIKMVRETVPFLKKQGGSIVIVSSDAAVQGNIQGGLYGATKGAVTAFAKSVALELAIDHIRVNVACLGDIKTPLLDNQFATFGGSEEEAASVYPLLRIGKPEEAAEVIAFLISDKASFMTGSVVMVDGGLTDW